MASFKTDNIKLQTSPLQNLFVDVKKILEQMEVKNKAIADTYESETSRAYGELWVAATEKDDSYITYKNWWTRDMFIDVDASVKIIDYDKYVESPYKVPFKFREHLREAGRAAFLSEYEELNDYYRMLMGLPDTDDTEYIYLSEELQTKYGVSSDTPVHELTVHLQNMYMATDEYVQVVSDNPGKEYLLYIGNKKVDLYSARKAKDFEIIRYPTDRSAINPFLLDRFAQLYSDYREYVMVVLYNTQLEDSYEGYRDFMGFLITSFVLLQLGNAALAESRRHSFLDDTVIYTLMSMYNIPDSLILTKETRRNLAAQLVKLVKEKSTDDVYYDLVKILGYQDVVINKLMMMRGDQFDDDGRVTGEVKPYFLALDLLDENPYETIASGNAKIYSYEEITNADPMWWETDEIHELVTQRPYTIADSKYITIEAVIHQMEFLFESIYFSRMIIDNKQYTDEYEIEIPSLFGSETVSIFDCVLGLICATCLNNKLDGTIFNETDQLLAAAGFNFELDLDLLSEYLDTTSYVDRTRLMQFLSDIRIDELSDIPRVMNDIIVPLRQWLETKIVNATERKEYIEYESIYRAIFTYDASRNKFLDDFTMPIEIIRERYELSEDGLLALQHFYPRTMSGDAYTVEDFNESTNRTRYHYPFLSLTNEVNWYIHVITDTEDRGYVYFHDILNCDDCRTLTNADGNRVFMDYVNDELVLNEAAVEKAISLIEALPDDDLIDAYFQVYTPILNSGGKLFEVNSQLPSEIRVPGMFKSILRDKLKMDADGLCVQAKTYFELLYRSNPLMYSLIVGDKRYDTDKDAWLNDVMALITSLESELDLHMKYYEESIVGKDLFFKPLITLIKRFKSTLVDIAKTDLRFIFDDKMDIGGNSNMFKLFDDMSSSSRHIFLWLNGYLSQFGLFDTMRKMHTSITMKDRVETYETLIGDGFAAQQETVRLGSVHMGDEMLFKKNGTDIDPVGHESTWYAGDPSEGRYSDDDVAVFRTRTGTSTMNVNVDLDGWVDFVESYDYDEE